MMPTMEHVEVSGKRRMQILATGLLPLIALVAILGMASAHGLDILRVFTTIDKRDAANHVVVTKVFGVPVASRPATQRDLNREDSVAGIIKIVVLLVSAVITAVAFLMCFSSVTGRPRKLLVWFDAKLGSVQWSGQKPPRGAMLPPLIQGSPPAGRDV